MISTRNYTHLYDVWNWQNIGLKGQWWRNGVSRDLFASVGTTPALFGSTSGALIQQSPNVFATLPSWSQALSNVPIGRLISAGGQLYMASSPGCSATPSATCP